MISSVIHSPSEKPFQYTCTRQIYPAQDNTNVYYAACLLNSSITKSLEQANPVIGRLWKYLPATTGASKDLTGKINVSHLLPKNKTYYNLHFPDHPTLIRRCELDVT